MTGILEHCAHCRGGHTVNQVCTHGTCAGCIWTWQADEIFEDPLRVAEAAGLHADLAREAIRSTAEVGEILERGRVIRRERDMLPWWALVRRHRANQAIAEIIEEAVRVDGHNVANVVALATAVVPS